MNWIVAGLIGGVGAFFADFVMWGKVFTKGMEQYGTMAATPEEGKKMMAANMPKAAGLALLFGLLLACFYARLRGGLWVQGGGPALITGDEGETGVSVSRYTDLSTDGGRRRLTLFGLDSYYYPIGARGVAPFAATELGLARVAESAPATQCPALLCQDTVSTSSQLASAFGLGVRVNLGSSAVAALEGRFLQVPGSQIQSLEARLNASVALGRQHRGDFLEGTLGPAASVFFPVSGALPARAPFAGVRFRRDTKKAGTVGLKIDFAPLRLTASCSPMGCNEPNAILFAPGYETALRPPWGRVYGEVGVLLAVHPAPGRAQGGL